MNRPLLSAIAGALALAAGTARAQDSALAHPLTLGDAVRFAARSNATAQEARDRADAADARVTQRRAELLPSFDGSALESGRTYNSATFGFPIPGLDPNGILIGPVKTLDLRLHGEIPLVDIAAYKRVSSAKSAAAASGADAMNIADEAGELAAREYVRVQRAEALVTARLADSVLADSLLGIAREQLASGVGVAIDVTRAQVQLSTVRAQLIFQRADRDRSRLEFLRVLNLPLDTRYALADTLDRLAPVAALPSESAAVSEALRTRSDIRAAQQQLVSSQSAVSSIKWEHAPRLAAAGDYGTIGVNGLSYLPTYSWGVQLSVPIFDGLRREARTEEQEAGVREVRTRLNALTQQASLEVRAAIVDLAAAREQLVVARDRLALSALEVAQARERFVAGVAGNLDVIQASSNLNTSRSQLVEALASYQDARVALARAQGTVTALP
jgi:outer membrane protein TolC